MLWLLETGAFNAMETAVKAGVIPSAQQEADFTASRSEISTRADSRILTTAGNTAEIAIKGVLTQRPSFLAMLFGGGNTTYGEVIAALAQAEADPTVERIDLMIESPGGEFDGLFDVLAAIQATNKPIRAMISSLGASAAFAIASQANEIIAANVATRVGSVGVVATIGVKDDEVTITSTNAPKKRPDVSTEEGRAMVREELDAMHEIFVDAIASGRDTTSEKINAEFGQGATLLAGEALKRGMIDGVGAKTLSLVKNASIKSVRKGGKTTEKGPMDLTTLKASHPDVYAAAMEDGVLKERDRCTAHLIAGEASGDMKTAVGAVKTGAAMTETLRAEYFAAGLNRNDLARRQADDGDVAAAADNADTSTDDEKEGKAYADMFSQAAVSCNVEVEA